MLGLCIGRAKKKKGQSKDRGEGRRKKATKENLHCAESHEAESALFSKTATFTFRAPAPLAAGPLCVFFPLLFLMKPLGPLSSKLLLGKKVNQMS